MGCCQPQCPGLFNDVRDLRSLRQVFFLSGDLLHIIINFNFSRQQNQSLGFVLFYNAAIAFPESFVLFTIALPGIPNHKWFVKDMHI